MQRDLCHNEQVPAVDVVAKEWEVGFAERFGNAVQRRRSALGLSVQKVSDRTAALHYPITRVAITKIEGNKRSGKIDVAELLVLALALEIPPALLLFPDFPHELVEIAPGKRATSGAAVEWLAGQPGWEVSAENPGTQLVEAVARLAELNESLFDARMMRQTLPPPGDEQTAEQRRQVADALINTHETNIAVTTHQIEAARSQLWDPKSSDA